METHRADPVEEAAPCTERGTALMLAVFLGMLAAGLTFSFAFLLRASPVGVESGFVLSGQPGQLARSGITEALNWFRLHPVQPVLEFEPRSTASSASPGTGDAAIGLVRDFRIDGSSWGRYEVWKPWSGDPDPERRRWREKMMVEDTSAGRRMAPGSAWRLKCIGYVYRRMDPGLAFDRFPNQVLASEVLEVEIVRVGLDPVGASAVAIRGGAELDLRAGSRILGGEEGAAITFPSDSAIPNVGLEGAVVEGAPDLAPLADYDDSLEGILGIDDGGLRAVADVVVTSAAGFPSPVPDNGIVLSSLRTLTLSGRRPLSGSGVVVHLGDLTLEADSASGFRGVLYVDGDLVVDGPVEIAGTVIVTGRLTMGSTSEPATLRYDAEALAALRRLLGEYRFLTPVRRSETGQ